MSDEQVIFSMVRVGRMFPPANKQVLPYGNIRVEGAGQPSGSPVYSGCYLLDQYEISGEIKSTVAVTWSFSLASGSITSDAIAAPGSTCSSTSSLPLTSTQRRSSTTL